MKTVKEVSELTGISIRTLRYYDEIGLLVPAERSKAGYRLYDRRNLEKLNAILFLRELDVPIFMVKQILHEENCDYSAALKGYRQVLVRKINRLKGLLDVVDGMSAISEKIDFEAFDHKDAEMVAEVLKNSVKIQDEDAQKTYVGLDELVKQNLVEGKNGIEILHIYGSKENYLDAVKQSAEQQETNQILREELKEIYFAFADLANDYERTQELTKQLEDNTKKMFRTSNARYILSKIAEDYATKGVNARVLDQLYGAGVTDTIANAILEYYGVEEKNGRKNKCNASAGAKENQI